MDVQMPEMDGVEATRRIHERWGEDGRPWIIAMTAHALSGDRERYLGAGMDDYISKPVRVDELMEALQRCRPLVGCPDIPAVTLQTGPQPTDAAAAIDNTVISKVRAIGGENASAFLAELIAAFEEDANKLLAELREAAAENNAEGLRRAAHTLKGSSATLGAMRLSAMCQELELMGCQGRLAGVTERVAQIETEYEHVKAALAAA